MSSIAKYFLDKGNEIMGYDRVKSEIVENLSKEGVKVLDKTDVNLLPDNFKSNDVIVIYSSAISEENTIKDNSRFFENIEDVPTQAYTMGMSSIMGAEKIYLVAQGKHKKEILEEAVYGDVTDEIPASLLQEHPNCEVYYSEWNR